MILIKNKHNTEYTCSDYRSTSDSHILQLYGIIKIRIINIPCYSYLVLS